MVTIVLGWLGWKGLEFGGRTVRVSEFAAAQQQANSSSQLTESPLKSPGAPTRFGIAAEDTLKDFCLEDLGWICPNLSVKAGEFGFVEPICPFYIPLSTNSRLLDSIGEPKSGSKKSVNSITN